VALLQQSGSRISRRADGSWAQKNRFDSVQGRRQRGGLARITLNHLRSGRKHPLRWMTRDLDKLLAFRDQPALDLAVLSNSQDQDFGDDFWRAPDYT
jgi:hypothetical protein